MGLLSISFLLSITLSFSISATNVDEPKTFIVHIQNNLQPLQFSDIEEWYSSILHSLDSSDNPFDSGVVKVPFISTPRGRRHKNLLHVYKTVFHGFSATLTKQEARILQTRPEILALFPDRIRQIQTTRTPLFLGLTPAIAISNELLSISDYGANVVIGVLDTGVWPESRSFCDDGLEPIPLHWKGECTEGDRFQKTNCNKKLIGARFFTGGYDVGRSLNITSSIRSARDSDGHGTHTASIVAGSRVVNASFLDYYARGDAVGIAPKARLAVYKVCWERGCMDSDIIAGFDSAVNDGVDVISFSAGGGLSLPYHLEPIAIASFAAVEKGVLVSESAGNNGPEEGSLTSIAPWITTVGAGTIDRRFPADLILEDGRVLTGSSLYKGDPLPEKAFLPLIYAGNATARSSDSFESSVCSRKSLDPEQVRGKIVVCDGGFLIPSVNKGLAVKEAGGVGVIIANRMGDGEGLMAKPFLMPGLTLTESDSYKVRLYMNSTSNPRATLVFRGTEFGVKPAPVVASFSSRGPSSESIYILKPDLIAPGVNILAAWPDQLTDDDPRRGDFKIISGTSMACPHVSGIAALLKGAHQNWSPAMIRSALVTTAYSRDLDGKPLLDEFSYNEASVWATGAGHVDPRKAVDPGLVYDLTTDDYINFLCASNYSHQNIQVITRRSIDCSTTASKPWDLNLPVIVMAFNVSSSSKMEATVMRTVTHVSDGESSYTVAFTNPKGAKLAIDPPKMEFKSKGEKHSYLVKISADNVTMPSGNKQTEVGKLIWTDGKHHVTSPVVVVWLGGS